MKQAKKGVKGFVRIPIEQRFWEKVQKRSDDECWPWIGTTYPRGYGMFYMNGRNVRAHRVSWSLFHGKEFPKDMDGCHSCDNPNCVNPRHIWPGTMSDNIKDAVRKGRLRTPTQRGIPNRNAAKTHCKSGHEFTPENTYQTKRGTRSCRICMAVFRKNYEIRERARALLGKERG